MKYESIIFEKYDGIVKIKLNRPKTFNSLNAMILNEMIKALEICAEDVTIKAIIITGEGKAFCSGGDIRYFNEHIKIDQSEPFRKLIPLMNLAIINIRRIQKPIIASINGVTGGGGMSIAAACDLRICAKSAKFKAGYTEIGLVGDGGLTLMLPLLVGFGRAIELMLIDPLFDAQKALEWGFVNYAVEDSELDKFVQNKALKLAKGPTRAYAIVKENINQAMIGLLEHQLELERVGMINASKTADYINGVKAFLEKRKPVFKGY